MIKIIYQLKIIKPNLKLLKLIVISSYFYLKLIFDFNILRIFKKYVLLYIFTSKRPLLAKKM